MIAEKKNCNAFDIIFKSSNSTLAFNLLDEKIQ